MESHNNTPRNTNSNHHRRNKHRRRPRRGPDAVVGPPAVNVQAEEWGATAEPWPGVVASVTLSDETDVSKEIVSVWRQNVYAADHGDPLQKMEGLYDRLDKEREKWTQRLNNPLTWEWGGAEPDELNGWARETKEATGWDDYQQDELNNWTNDVVYPGGDQQANSDKTPDGPSNHRSTDKTPPLPQLVSTYADKLKGDGRQRSHAFVQLPTEAKVEKIREVAYQLKGFKKH